MTDFPRLIEHAFPLKQTSLDSVHEKNVRHGHISTLHIWPARRPLAACRAALIATLLPDPGTPELRRALCEKIGGRVVKKIERKKMPNGQTVERVKEETEGGILHWGRETENADTLEWFRQEIRKAYGGRAPRVLDPFAGGGAIPLEAMRLGCEATAVDINPVAWFVLKCTLEYPQNLAGQKRPLPGFILNNEAFMQAFYKANPSAEENGNAGGKQEGMLFAAGAAAQAPDADLAWHVRAWGQWVLDKARRELSRFYPAYAAFEPLLKARAVQEKHAETRAPRAVPMKDNGTPDIAALNTEFSRDYLEDKRNPRWVAKPTVAYLWARTVKCKNCRAELPLLKTRWLCKKDNKRVLLRMTPKDDKSGVDFGIQTDVPVQGGNAAQKRENDKRVAGGTMSRSGATCPCCGAINTMQDIRLEGKAGRLGSVMTAVVVDGQSGKEYRLPTDREFAAAQIGEEQIQAAFKDVPFGVPDEPTPKGGGSGAGRAFSVQGYGLMLWRDLFTPRQLTALGTFVSATRAARRETATGGYSPEWTEAVTAYLACMHSRTADYMASLCVWENGAEEVKHVFMRWALPITWDFAEANPFAPTERLFAGGIISAFRVVNGLTSQLATGTVAPSIESHSSTLVIAKGLDLVFTDPPYYDAIPYSDLMDFFYVWLRRSLSGLSPEIDAPFRSALAPKWDNVANDGELIDDCSRHNSDAAKSKASYEDGIARVFARCAQALKIDGRMVVVFANKQPEAWETLVGATIRAGFTVNGSWPIATEMPGGLRNLGRASLASSVWLICKKRPAAAKVGWDTGVLEEMRSNIGTRLQTYWDAGIRGPDFVWAATGPALEAYSKHPAVRKADQPGQVMTVAEFLNHVRRLVVDYVVGRVLSGEQGEATRASANDRLDDVTAYYLLHRHDFGLGEAPVGACILYAVSCDLSDTELVQTWNILSKTGADDVDEDEAAADEDAEEEPGSAGGKVRLKTWAQRKNPAMGYDAPNGRPVPLIDRVHRLMHLWKAGDVHKVDEYLDDHGMRRHELFKRLVQSLIELSEAGSDERSLLESLSNHIGGKGARRETALGLFGKASGDENEGGP